MTRNSVVSATSAPPGVSGAWLTLASAARLAFLLGMLCLGAAKSRFSAMFAGIAVAPPRKCGIEEIALRALSGFVPGSL